ncbi:MAG: sulfhydrogenase subunit delta [Gammaproteobacteria bacterium]|nr:sulfhydrogenase subunit delta [Gammaproteobacteria bacterium]
MAAQKLRMGVYKFTSCDGCQLAFINLGEDLIVLSRVAEIVHFTEIGIINPNAIVDVAFVEGSISTPDGLERIQEIRTNTKYLITIGACATSGGIQALRNFADKDAWMKSIYATPDTIATLKKSTPISDHVKVDLELWGCPVNGQQILSAIRMLLQKTTPVVRRDSVCMECKRQGNICVLVTKGTPCMGPVTQTGCGALCPGANRACYACYGPAQNVNTNSLTKQFSDLGLTDSEIERHFLFINNQAPAFKEAGIKINKRKES